MLTREDILRALERVRDPETGLSLLELGIVRFVDHEQERGRLIVSLAYARRTPSCFGCQPVAWMIQRKIVEELDRELSGLEGVREVEFRYS